MFFVTCSLKYDIRMLLLLREVAAILNLSFHGRTFQKPAAGVALRQPHWEHNQPNNLPSLLVQKRGNIVEERREFGDCRQLLRL